MGLDPNFERNPVDGSVSGFSYRSVYFKPVIKSDAEFILSLRSDPRLNGFLSPVTPALQQQEEWIEKYLERNNVPQPCEYYWVLQNLAGVSFGLVRIYNRKADGSAEWGSFVIIPDRPAGFTRDALWGSLCYAFSALKIDRLSLKVHKKNIKAVSLYRWAGFRLKNSLAEEDFYELTIKNLRKGYDENPTFNFPPA